MQEDIDRLTAAVPGVDWSVAISVDDGVVASAAADRVLPTASMGKVLLLLEVARRIDAGELEPHARLAVGPDDQVADSGLWQHLPEGALAVESLAVLVGAVSDNQGANVLLREVGLRSVEEVSVALGVPRTRLLDRIREVRSAEHPPWPSEGCAEDLVRLMETIAHGEALTPGASAMVARWLALDVDTSMVAGAFGVDPLAHLDGPVRLFHKTGTDAGVRVDAGHVTGPRGACAYAVLAHWDVSRPDRTLAVLDVMHSVGDVVRRRVA